jgi:hypothetical protein
MMQEIARNGLVNGELNAPHIFHMYTKGVLTADGIKQLHKKVTSLAQIRSESEEDAKPKAKSSAKPKRAGPKTDTAKNV